MDLPRSGTGANVILESYSIVGSFDRGELYSTSRSVSKVVDFRGLTTSDGTLELAAQLITIAIIFRYLCSPHIWANATGLGLQ